MPDQDIRTLFDPRQFRETGTQLIELLERYLRDNLTGESSVLD